MQKIRIAISGIGGVGGYYGGKPPVTTIIRMLPTSFIARNEHLDAIRQNGSQG